MKYKIIEDANPILVRAYHGSSFKFERFTIDKTNIDSDFGAGIYFTSEIEDAYFYATDHPDIKHRINDEVERIWKELWNKSSEVFKQTIASSYEGDFIDYTNEHIDTYNRDYLREYNEFYGTNYKWVSRSFDIRLNVFHDVKEKQMGEVQNIIHVDLKFNNLAIVDTEKFKPEGKWWTETKYLGTFVESKDIQRVIVKLAPLFIVRDDYWIYKEGKMSNEEKNESFVRIVKRCLSEGNRFVKNDVWYKGGTLSKIAEMLKVEQMMSTNIMKLNANEVSAKGELTRMIALELGYDGIQIKDAFSRYNLKRKRKRKKRFSHYVVFEENQINIIKVEKASNYSFN
jgi:hypothetical protein